MIYLIRLMISRIFFGTGIGVVKERIYYRRREQQYDLAGKTNYRAGFRV